MIHCTGNHKGDVCENDLDGDGYNDALDNCPQNRFMHQTDFRKYRIINLDPTDGEPSPAWVVLDHGREFAQAAETNATSIVVGKPQLSRL